MSAGRRNFVLMTSLLAMLIFATFAFREFVAAGKMETGIAFALLTPATAVWELVRAFNRGREASDAAVRMLAVVAFAMAGMALGR